MQQFLLFKLLTREDRSSTGHTLGRAQSQPPNTTPERNLNPLSCSALRCLTHVAMLLGTDHNMQVPQLVLPYACYGKVYVIAPCFFLKSFICLFVPRLA